MNENFGQIKCYNCKSSLLGYKEDMEKYPDDFCNCYKPRLRFIALKNVKDPDVLIRAVENALEDANWHSQEGIPEALYASLVKKLKANEKQKTIIARVICDVIYDAI